MKLIEDRYITINNRLLFCEDWTEGNIVYEFVDTDDYRKMVVLKDGFYRYFKNDVYFIIENGKIKIINKFIWQL